MSTLSQDAPKAHAFIKGLCDDPGCYLDEVAIFFYMKAQHKLSRAYLVRGSKALRPKSLTDAEIEKFVLGVGENVAKRHYGELTSPAVEPLGDATLAVIPAYHQAEERNAMLLICAVHYGAHDAMLRVDMEEHGPTMSKLLLQELGRNKAMPTKTVPGDCPTVETRAVN